jgi:hypothetical protein
MEFFQARSVSVVVSAQVIKVEGKTISEQDAAYIGVSR